MSQGTAGANILSNVISGMQDSGISKEISADGNGHLEVAIHSPLLPFGSLHTESLTPIFQADGVYGVNAGQNLSTISGSGVATTENSSFKVNTGTTIYSFATIQGRKRLRYRAGQGVIGRFAGSFTTPTANSYQLAGFGHAEDGVYFGCVNAEFGIFYVKRSKRAIYTLTVSTGATSANDATITLNGTAFTVPLTSGSNIQRTVYDISKFIYTGWDAYPSSPNTVTFVKNSAGATAGAFTYSAGATGSAGVIALTRAGTVGTETFIAQADWNGDKLDGTGASGVTLDITKGNVFEIGIQYLGYGTVTFGIEVVPPNSNNAIFIHVHTLKNPNSLTDTTFGNPSFPFTTAVYSAGSTTDLAIKIGSYAGFIEGGKTLHGNRFTYVNTLTTVGSSNIQALFTIMNARVYNNVVNQSIINILSVAGALKHTSPCIFYLVKNGVLGGNPSFVPLSSISCSLQDTASTTVSYTLVEQLIWTGHLGDTGEIDHHFGNGSFNAEEVTLQPGEWLTLGAKAVTGTPSYVTGTINTREDQ